jgi:hypothetical protein
MPAWNLAATTWNDAPLKRTYRHAMVEVIVSGQRSFVPRTSTRLITNLHLSAQPMALVAVSGQRSFVPRTSTRLITNLHLSEQPIVSFTAVSRG